MKKVGPKKSHWLMAALLVALALVASSISTFAQSGAFAPLEPFTRVRAGNVAWGDYDNDGDLDIVISGLSTGGLLTQLYRNDGSHTFTPVAAPFHNVFQSAMAWGDYDNDNDLDLLLTGMDDDFERHSAVYRNDGSNGQGGWIFTDTNAVLRNVDVGSAEWWDFDNDGDLDILISGRTRVNSGFVTIVRTYENIDGEFFGGNDTDLPQGGDARRAAPGDYDDDGDLDLFIWPGGLYRNDGNGDFTLVGNEFEQVWHGGAAWGDYDSDGDLDLALMGRTNDNADVIKLYRNDGSDGSGGWTFTSVATGIDMSLVSFLMWGDYDNDGDLDLLLTGEREEDDFVVSRVYRNDGPGIAAAWTFTNIQAGLQGFWNARGAWGDSDNDGDLDFVLVGGRGGAPTTDSTILYRNEVATANTLPAPPGNLSAALDGEQLVLSWDAALDGQTPTPGLTYNVRVGTTPGGSDVVSPMAFTPVAEELAARGGTPSEGWRLVPEFGNAQHGTSYVFKRLEGGTYYWSVQAIDTAFAGSAFSKEGTFEADPLAADVASFTATPGDGNIRVQWETTSEVDNSGFNLYRGTNSATPDVQLNEVLIASEAPDSTEGYSYAWVDVEVEGNTTYYYWLETVGTDGSTARVGPVTATLNVPTSVTLNGLTTPAGKLPVPAFGVLALAALGVVWLRYRFRR